MKRPCAKSRPERVSKPWGHELIFARTPHYAGKVLHIRKGHRLSLQLHREKTESILVVKGRLRLIYGRTPKRLAALTLTPGEAFHLPAGLIHRFHAIETTALFEVSTAQLNDVVRLSDDYGRTRPA
ncbi:MAG: cupin domain-containing protein [Nitrospirae bacterium]|nr:cupin domain-containing protein [Nitrospirota bacterium]